MKHLTTVVVAEDVEIYMDGLLLALIHLNTVQVIGTAFNGKELVKLVTELKPDLVIADIMMPMMSGIEACRIITASFPHVSVIATTIFEEESLIIDMIDAGAIGFVMKNSGRDVLLQAIEACKKGNNYYCPVTNKNLVMHNSRLRARAKLPQFTARELEIIPLICQDYSHAEIAKKLYLSKTTIDICSHRILQKMNQRSAVGILRYAIEHGLYSIDAGK